MDLESKVVLSDSFRQYGVLVAKKGTKGTIKKVYQTLSSNNVDQIEVCDIEVTTNGKRDSLMSVPTKIVELQQDNSSTRKSKNDMTNEDLIEQLIMISAQQAQISTTTQKFAEFGSKIESIKNILLDRLNNSAK